MAKAKIVTDVSNKYFTNNKINVGTGIPTTGVYKAGDMIISSSANSTAFGWICTVAGTPGTWKVLQSGNDRTNVSWGNVSGKPSTFTPVIGTTSTTAFRGDHGNTAYNHSRSTHAPANSQKNSDITKAEIEAKLKADIFTHSHQDNPVNDLRDVNNTPAQYNIASKFEFKRRSTINNPPEGNSVYCVTRTLKGWMNSTGGNALQLSYGCDNETTIPYMAVRTGDNEATSWGAWQKIFTSQKPPNAWEVGAVSKAGDEMSGNLSGPGMILWNNTAGFKAMTTGGSHYHVMGVDASNNIYLGWDNQTYINVNNTMRVYRDIHHMSGTLTTTSLNITPTDYPNLKYGENHVRFEYAKNENVVYLAGSETQSTGLHLPFRAKHLESVQNYMKFGGTWFTIASSAPGYGGVWFQI